MIVAVTPFVLRADAGADGAAIYKSKCAICHGADGKGKTATGKSLHVRDLGSPEVQKMTNEEMQKVIVDGKEKMPGFKSSLDQESLDAVIAFVRKFGGGDSERAASVINAPTTSISKGFRRTR